MKKGKLIVFEGIDGAGTTTHSKRLVERLNDTGIPAKWTSQPRGDSPTGRYIREVFEGKHGPLPPWQEMAMLFQADREGSYLQIQKWLDEGLIVVSDRYWHSGVAYQGVSAGADQQVAEELIRSLNEKKICPDLLGVLDVPVAVGLSRKNKAPDLFEKGDFLERVRASYHRHWAPFLLSTENSTTSETAALVWERVQVLLNGS